MCTLDPEQVGSLRFRRRLIQSSGFPPDWREGDYFCTQQLGHLSKAEILNLIFDTSQYRDEEEGAS